MDEDPNNLNIRIGPGMGFEASGSGRFGVRAVVILRVAHLAFRAFCYGLAFGWW